KPYDKAGYFMKQIMILALVLGLAGGSAFAAKPAKANAKAARQAQKNSANLIAKYDKNKNGAIDADEVETIQKAFATDPALKPFDKNGDGKLDEVEVSAMNPPEKKKKK